MKRKHQLFACFILFISLSVPLLAFAETTYNQYELPEIGVTIPIPSDYYVFTRNMPSTSPALSAYGLTSSEVDDILVAQNIYLDSYSYDSYKEIKVTMIGSLISDFSTFSDNTLSFMASSWIQAMENAGMTIDNYDIYHSGDITYVRFWEHSSDGSGIYALQYYTTFNSRAINITYFSYSQEITEFDEKFILEIINKTVFSDKTVIISQTITNTNPLDFQYEVLNNENARIIGYTGQQTSISIPEKIDGYTISEIGVLEKNYAVTTVMIPKTITNVEGNPFKNLSSLQSVFVSDDNPYFISENGILYSKNKEKILCYPPKLKGERFVIPSLTQVIGKESFYGCDSLLFIEITNGVQSIEEDAFACADSITDIFIPRSVSKIKKNPFVYSFGLMSITVDPLNQYYYSQDGVLFERSSKALVCFPHNKHVSEYAIPDGIITIGAQAFLWHEEKTIIHFPKSLQFLQEDAFCECKKFIFPDLLSSIKSVGDYAFENCDLIERVVIPSSVDSIGIRAFGDCSGIKEIIIEDGIEEISDYAFLACDSLEKITIPNSVIKIGLGAFSSCQKLSSLYIPNSVQSIGINAFDKCPNLVITADAGSYAETYCIQNEIKLSNKSGFNLSNKNYYINESYKVKILIPDGWKEKELSQERSFIIAKFVPIKEDGTCIVLSCVDLWNQIDNNTRTTLEKEGVSRNDFDNSLYNENDIADQFGIHSTTVQKRLFGQQEYFIFTITQTDNSYGTPFTMDISTAICVYNGYMYSIQFTGTEKTNTYYNSFIEFLSSIDYME